MYHLIFIILLFSTYAFFSKPNKIIDFFIFLLLLLFVIFRYGQGSDYFNYIYLFNSTADEFETALTYKDLNFITNEIGFSSISYIWMKILKFTPESLTIVYSAISFILVWLFIKKYSSRPIISLFIFYCTFYLIYPFSGIRQGICISIFIYYLIPLLYKKKYLHYYLLSFLLFTIHFSSVILFIIPVVNMVNRYKPRQIYTIAFIALGVGIVLNQVLFSFFSTLDIIGGKVDAYTQKNTLDFMSLILRILLIIPIMLTYKVYERNSIRDLFLKIYILGFLLYLIFMSSSLISSRINVFMRYFEIILLVDSLLYVFKDLHIKMLNLTYIVAIMTVLYVKNINSFIDQGPYYDNVYFYNYPYVSVFNKRKIIETRYIPPFFQKYVIYD